MPDVYESPRYYEAAFSFRNIAHEVDVFQDCIRRHSLVPVSTFLEVACGNSPHLLELVSRGFRYVGIDLSDPMLAYAKSKLPDSNKVLLLKADMRDFRVDGNAQFAFVALGSLFTTSTEQLTSHFRSVGAVLEPGGLYLLDWCVQFGAMGSGGETWTIRQGEMTVDTEVRGQIVDPVQQLFEETIKLNVTDHGKSYTCSNSTRFRAIYPQEFLLFVKYCTDFEFVGWWNDWDLDRPLEAGGKINRPIVLLRRK